MGELGPDQFFLLKCSVSNTRAPTCLPPRTARSPCHTGTRGAPQALTGFGFLRDLTQMHQGCSQGQP